MVGIFDFSFFNSKIDDKTKKSINSKILKDYYGEQQPGTVILTKNENNLALKTENISFVSLCRFPYGEIPSDYAYVAMRGVILSILEFNKRAIDMNLKPIKVVVIPSFSFGDCPLESRKYVSTLYIL